MDYLQRLAWLFLDSAIVSSALQTSAHLLALVDHCFEHFEVLAWLSIALDAFDLSGAFLWRKQNG